MSANYPKHRANMWRASSHHTSALSHPFGRGFLHLRACPFEVDACPAFHWKYVVFLLHAKTCSLRSYSKNMPFTSINKKYVESSHTYMDNMPSSPWIWKYANLCQLRKICCVRHIRKIFFLLTTTKNMPYSPWNEKYAFLNHLPKICLISPDTKNMPYMHFNEKYAVFLQWRKICCLRHIRKICFMFPSTQKYAVSSCYIRILCWFTLFD